MRKRTLWLFVALFATLLFAAPAAAQSYKSLWKKVSKAQDDDLPKTALASIDLIAQKAQAKGNADQLIKATAYRIRTAYDISRDSAFVELAKARELYRAENRPVERALWARMLADELERVASWRDTALRHEARVLQSTVLDDIDALSNARYTNYSGLFAGGKDSRYYNNDVLHVLMKEYASSRGELSSTLQQKKLSDIVALYQRKGNKEAALLSELTLLGLIGERSHPMEEDSVFCRLRSLAKANEAMPLNVETYVALIERGKSYYRTVSQDSLLVALAEEGIRLYGKQAASAPLHNFIAEMNKPELNLRGLQEKLYPGQIYEVELTTKEISRGEIRIYRYNTPSAQDYQKAQTTGRKITYTLERSDPFSVDLVKDYRSKTVKIPFAAPSRPGIYRIVLFDGQKEHKAKQFYCTRLKPINLASSGNQTLLTVVDAKNGTPVAGARCAEVFSKGKVHETARIIETDQRGSYLFKEEPVSHLYYYLSAGDDAYAPQFQINKIDKVSIDSKEYCKLYTYLDRGIYRPGQEVIVGGFAFTQQRDSTLTVAADREVALKLYNANRVNVGDTTVVTDEFGAFSATMQLPEGGLPGSFSIESVLKSGDKSSRAATDQVYFEVQEYKRPTFVVEIDRLTQAYAEGDTVHITGVAHTYTGLPVEGARVSAKSLRRELLRWYMDESAKSEELAVCDTFTDANGRFDIPLVLNGNSPYNYSRTCFETNVSVTSPAGETHSAKHYCFTSKRRAYLSAKWPSVFCFEENPGVDVRVTNTAGADLPAKGWYTISRADVVYQQGSFVAGEPIRLTRSQLPPSGRYKVTTYAIAEGDTLKTSSTVHFFSLTDKRPASGETFWSYTRPNADGDSVLVVIATPQRDVTLFCVEQSTDRERLRGELMEVSDTLLVMNLGYKPEYGDGASFTFAFVKNDTLFHLETSVVKPQPDKRLNLSWETFRSELTPGSKEEWTLRVTYPDGRPANASVMARLYDASLDALRDYQWAFGLHFSRSLPRHSWSTPSNYYQSLYSNYTINNLYAPGFVFAQWDISISRQKRRISYNDAAAARLSAPMGEVNMLRSQVTYKEVGKVGFGAVTEEADEGAAEEAVQPAEDNSLRTNFNETAFFMPTLRTDTAGLVSLSFTLPESLTQWNFRALAHTRDLNFGKLSDKMVARKEFMVRPQLPRFLREGDEAQIPFTIDNLSETALSGTATLRLIDAQTEKTLLTLKRPFSAEAGKSISDAFELDADKLKGAPVVVCRLTASAANFSDGEEHYLPVLTAREAVESTLPFTLKTAGTTTMRIDTLWSKASGITDKRLTVEISSNPTWYVVNALPVLADGDGITAFGRAEKLYALALASHIAQRNPAIKKAFETPEEVEGWSAVLSRNESLKQTLLKESPWVCEATTEAARAEALSSLFDEASLSLRMQAGIESLRQLQNSDGSWSWCPQLSGSTYTTASVCVTLARLVRLTGTTRFNKMLREAFAYLEKKVAADVAYMKKHKVKSCGYIWLGYLYARALADMAPTDKDAKKDIDYLLEAVLENVGSQDMHTKSLSAVVLSFYGKDKAAATALQSLMEHTVATEEAGRYFDTHRAPMTYRSYRIPTHTATMEALTFRNEATYADTLRQMRLWLLQAKRAQMWETSSTTVDAIYALLCEAGSQAASDLTKETMPVHYVLRQGSRYVAGNSSDEAKGKQTVGYFCDHYTEAADLKADRIELQKHDEGLSWGTVYAQYTLPVEQVAASGKGMTLKRTLEVEHAGQWKAIGSTDVLTTGDHVRMMFTLTADRDLDHVSVRTGRAACFEPEHQMSGRAFANGLVFYRAVRDADTEFFIERLPKGTHTFTEDFRIDRAGAYRCAPARAQCLYAPEFVAISTAAAVKTKAVKR